MSEDKNNNFGSWLDDDDEGGLYGGTEDWLDEKDVEPEPAREFGHIKLPEEPEIFSYTENEEDPFSSEEEELDLGSFKNEPEEELADWNETISRPIEEEKISVIHTEETPEKKSISENLSEKMDSLKNAAWIGKIKDFFKKDNLKNVFQIDSLKNYSEEDEEPETPREEEKAGGIFQKKTIKMAAIGAGCALAIFLIVLAATRLGKDKPAEEAASEEPVNTIATEPVQITELKHLSFFQLSMEHASDRVSVKEFSQILDMLYNDDYVLIDVYSLVNVDDNGAFSLKEMIDVPEGKKPLILSVQDVSYPAILQNSAFAKRMVVDGDGYIHNEYVDEAGIATMGDYDVIPLVDAFIREHPDFSYNGAKGLVGLTGYNGIFGYRTSIYPETGENPFGQIDFEYEKQSAGIVIDALQRSGWKFASNGFALVSYGSEYSMIETDIKAWLEKVGSLVGSTDLLIFPRQTDIGSWAPYTNDNPKYVLLKEMGFRYFFIDENETPDFLQVESEYVRQAITEINTFEEFKSIFM